LWQLIKYSLLVVT